MEEIILVDTRDREVGSCEKLAAHVRPTLHRAFSVFLHSDGQMLLQRRNRSKYHSGGLWTNACCSHPRRGEPLMEAVHRRLVEELGFDCDVEELFSFMYRTAFSEHLFEYEFDHVFLGSYDGPITLNEEEASEIKWVALEELKKDVVEHPERYTSWFLIALHRVIKHVEGRGV